MFGVKNHACIISDICNDPYIKLALMRIRGHDAGKLWLTAFNAENAVESHFSWLILI
ncbi:hypothetical protein [Polaromonas glacialis]|uniref:hypothetical protein n=1 Tax=Polaromonas glacialis TaxID=866564 RepID=UPI0018DB44AC|nr:hypothetical protein [Polaromonas glacialis]